MGSVAPQGTCLRVQAKGTILLEAGFQGNHTSLNGKEETKGKKRPVAKEND